MTARFKKKGQGNFLSGDLPSIILIVISVGFFLSSVYMTLNRIDEAKKPLQLEAAAADAASIFMKENSKIRPADLTDVTTGYLAANIQDTEKTYNIKTYVKLISLSNSALSPCRSAGECVYGDEPEPNYEKIVKEFPIALRGDTDLDVFPALIAVTVYRLR